MKKNVLIKSAVALAAAWCMVPAQAANIILWDTTNSFATQPNGAAALLAFQKAANYWNQTLTNNVTINIEIGFAALGSGILGSTGSESQIVKVKDVYAGLAATGNSALDAIAVNNLTALNAQGGLAMRVNGYQTGTTGISTTASTYLDNNNSVNNIYLDVNQSVVKALGLTGKVDPSTPQQKFDAHITFSSAFQFDFNPTNGIGTGQYDFVSVATHELGHALGFVSGTDFYDIVGGPNGPLRTNFNNGVYGSANQDDFAIGSTLDLFRYGNGNAGGKAQLQWAAARDAFFSIDGVTPFNAGNPAQAELAAFSTGRYNGDGQQASHWKDNQAFVNAANPSCFISARPIGIMDPTMTSCDLGVVTDNDLAAFDAMGWNLSVDALNNPGYTANTAQIFALNGVATVITVPEPETYALMLAGLAAVGFVARKRKQA